MMSLIFPESYFIIEIRMRTACVPPQKCWSKFVFLALALRCVREWRWQWERTCFNDEVGGRRKGRPRTGKGARNLGYHDNGKKLIEIKIFDI